MISLDPVVKKLLDDARKLGASDIHLEPMQDRYKVRMRVKAQMVEAGEVSGGLKESLPAKLKLMAGLDSTQRMIAQDGAMKMGGVSARLSVVPVLNGESLVLRLFGSAGELEALANLGLTQTQQTLMADFLKRDWGLLILSGPTGAGKTTSFYAALRQIDPAVNKIITVEDPVEQRLVGVTQVPVKGQMRFADALRSILRHAPNVMGVGEIRDGESAQMALQAALTGHLVVATLHADSVVGVVTRLRELGLNQRILSQVLVGASSQRLLHQRGEDGQSSVRAVFEVSAVEAEFASAMAAGESAYRLQEILAESGFASLEQMAKAAVAAGEISQQSYLSEFAFAQESVVE